VDVIAVATTTLAVMRRIEAATTDPWLRERVPSAVLKYKYKHTKISLKWRKDSEGWLFMGYFPNERTASFKDIFVCLYLYFRTAGLSEEALKRFERLEEKDEGFAHVLEEIRSRLDLIDATIMKDRENTRTMKATRRRERQEDLRKMEIMEATRRRERQEDNTSNNTKYTVTTGIAVFSVYAATLTKGRN
jgi:hypothetical protein